LPFAPTELRSVDRAAEKLAHQPNGVVVQHVALAIPGDLIDLIPEDHLLDTATVHAVMFSKPLPEMARSAETWPKRHVPRNQNPTIFCCVSKRLALPEHR
jgi:hypothetical protein